jgi:hypothetical protein
MKKTLQDQYLLIKEGKGHVGVFLTEAKRQFPNIVRNAATFDETVASLKTKNIISENVFSVIPAIIDRPKKESYETAFEAFLAEAKKKNEDEKVKAEEKKVSKPVEEDLSHSFDYSDDKNPDNMIFGQIMMGYYAEMKDPKNADKTMQELKDIVFKNLAKDQIYYTKNAQFGVKDLGYATEAPALGEPKEPKGKYKASGYGDLKEGYDKFASKVKDDVTKKKDSKFTDKEKADKILQRKKEDHKRRKEAGEPYDETLLREVIRAMIAEELDIEDYKAKLRALEKPYESNKEDLAAIQKIYTSHIAGLNSIAQHLKENYESLDYYTSVISSNDMSEEDAYAYLEDQGLNSRQIDSIIDQVFPDNMDEAYQLVNINPRKSDKERGEREPQPFKMSYVDPSVIDSLTKNQHLRILRSPSNPENITLAIRARFVPTSAKNVGKNTDNLDKLPLDIPSDFKNFLTDKNNITGEKQLPTKEGVTELYKVLSNATLNKNGSLVLKVPNPNYVKEGVIGVIDNDVAPSIPLNLPISYSDDKNVAHYSDDNEYSGQDDLLDVEDYLDQIKGMSKGDAFDYLKEMGLERDEILTILRNHKPSSLRESVEKDLSDINKEAEHEVLQTKLDKIDALIDHRRSKLSKLDEDEDMKALTDKKKVKELEKDIKKLEVARKKVDKMMSKFKGKKATSKDIIDEVEDDEELPLETPLEASKEYLRYQANAEDRYDKGESLDSIFSTYTNIPPKMKRNLRDDLEGKINGMDF